MNNYEQRKKANILVYLLLFIILIAVIVLVTMMILYFTKGSNKELEKYYGTYELTTNNYNKYGDDIEPFKTIKITKENINNDKLITSNKINFIEFDELNAILIYFNDIASTSSKNDDRITELGFTKYCFTLDKKTLKQLDCPNMVGDQNLGESVTNNFIEYTRK